MKKARVSFFICMITLVFYTLASVAQQYITKDLVDSAAAGNYNGLLRFLMLLGIFFILYIIAASIRPLVENRYRNKLLHHLRIQYANALAQKPLSEFTPAKRAESLSVFNNDLNQICQEYYMTTLDMAGCAMTILFSVTALVTIDIWMTVIIVGGCFLMTLNPHFFTERTKERKLLYSLSLKEFNRNLTDFLEGIHITKTYLYEKKQLRKLEDASSRITFANYQMAKISASINLVATFLQCFQQFLILLVGVLFMFRGNLTAGGLLAAMQFNNIIALPITIFASLWNTRVAGKAIKTSFEKECGSGDRTDGAVEKWDLGDLNSITVNQLCCKKEKTVILKDLNFTFDAGKKYLLIGKSGSGKSTLMRLLYGLDHQYDGEILMNGREIRGIEKNSFYEHIAMVFQEPYLFQMNLTDNITLEEEYPKEVVENIIRQVGLNELAGKLSGKELDEETLHTLSGGERQRVALARALIRKRDFLLLDEVTSSVDHETLIRIEEILLGCDCGILNVTHNPYKEHLAKYDQILLLDQAELIASGTYEELVRSGRME